MINLMLLLAFLQMPVRSISSDHVVVYCPVDVDRGVASAYLSVLENSYRKYSGLLDLGQNDKISVRLCEDKYDFADLTGADSSFSPLWKNGKLFVIALDNLDLPGYRKALDAGVIRGVLQGIRRNGAPSWLIYSAAAYLSGEYKGLTPPPVENVKYFSDLEEKMQSVSTPTDLSDLLYYLGTTGEFLDMKFGAGSLKRLLSQFDRLTSFGNAVGSAFHMSVRDLELDWHSYLVESIGRQP